MATGGDSSSHFLIKVALGLPEAYLTHRIRNQQLRTNIMLEEHHVSADAFLHEIGFCESQPRTRELLEKWLRCALSSRHPTV